MAIAALSLDDFKVLNDQQGHAFCDSILRRIAEVLESSLARFLVARSSGKEFYVLLRGLDNDKAVRVMDKVRAIVSSEDFQTSEGPVYVTCSVGVANTLGERLQDQVTMAESYLLRAKQAGKNIVFGEEDDIEEDIDASSE